MLYKTISDTATYVQNVCEMKRGLLEGLLIHQFQLLFRGQGNKNFELIPSIGRKRSSAVSCSIFNEERNLIEMAKYKLPDVFRHDLTPVELLALLQHHGIPTRLLDITENALVALYFACCSEKESDGEVIVFKSCIDDVTNYPVVNAIADSYRFARSTFSCLSLFYGNVKTQPYFLEQKQQLEMCDKDNEAGGRWIAECCENILYIHAPVRSMRQQVQQGRYILFPNNIIEEEELKEKCFETKLEPISKEHKDIAARFIIPKECKQQLLEELTVLGITKSTLFCDSIDTVCKGITDTFTKRY